MCDDVTVNKLLCDYLFVSQIFCAHSQLHRQSFRIELVKFGRFLFIFLEFGKTKMMEKDSLYSRDFLFFLVRNVCDAELIIIIVKLHIMRQYLQKVGVGDVQSREDAHRQRSRLHAPPSYATPTNLGPWTVT